MSHHTIFFFFSPSPEHPVSGLSLTLEEAQNNSIHQADWITIAEDLFADQ